VKRLLVVLGFVVALGVFSEARAAGWFSSGVVTNPTASQVLADTGPISGPTQITFCYIVAGTVASIFDVQLVASNGTTVRGEQYVPVPASSTQNFCLGQGLNIQTVANNDHLRILNVASVTGKVSVSLWQN